jgi:hypothetical protein
VLYVPNFEDAAVSLTGDATISYRECTISFRDVRSKHEVLHLLEETSKGFVKDVMRLQISGYVTLMLD